MAEQIPFPNCVLCGRSDCAGHAIPNPPLAYHDETARRFDDVPSYPDESYFSFRRRQRRLRRQRDRRINRWLRETSLSFLAGRLIGLPVAFLARCIRNAAAGFLSAFTR